MLGVEGSRDKARVWLRWVVSALLPVLAACSALPASGPTSLELTANNNETSDFNYALVDVDSRLVAALDHYHPGFGPTFRSKRRYFASNALAPGDIIAITVYETGGPSLFPPPAVVPGQAASSQNEAGRVSTGASNIPPQVIEADGTISVPFVGRMKVTGLTPGQAAAQIQAALEGKAVSPQVLVTLVNNIGNAVTVNGEVNRAEAVPLSSRGERLLDVIAAAGGPRYPAYETYVQVMRAGKVGNVLLQTIVNNPAENILVQPRDVIYVSRNPRVFAVLGASRQVSVFPFAREKVSLAEAIAQAGGPADNIGNPSGIYLLRFEPWTLAQSIVPGDQLQRYGTSPPDVLPVLYHVDMRSAQGYFLTQAMEMRDKDVVLITNAETTQLDKLMGTINGVLGTLNQSSNTIFNLKRIQNL